MVLSISLMEGMKVEVDGKHINIVFNERKTKTLVGKAFFPMWLIRAKTTEQAENTVSSDVISVIITDNNKIKTTRMGDI